MAQSTGRVARFTAAGPPSASRRSTFPIRPINRNSLRPRSNPARPIIRQQSTSSPRLNNALAAFDPSGFERLRQAFHDLELGAVSATVPERHQGWAELRAGQHPRPGYEMALVTLPRQSVKALVEHRLGPFAPPEPALGLDLPVRLPQAVRGLVERQVRRNRRTAAHVQVSLEKHFGGVIQRADPTKGFQGQPL